MQPPGAPMEALRTQPPTLVGRHIAGRDGGHRTSHYGQRPVALASDRSVRQQHDCPRGAVGRPTRHPSATRLETTTLYAANSWNALRLYAAVTRTPAHEWYWRATPGNINKAESLTALHYLMLGLKLPASRACSTHCQLLGIRRCRARSRSTRVPPTPIAAASSSDRAASAVTTMRTADNNAFVFVSKGQPLFISGGYYPYFMSPHHALVGRATRFKNALTFDGGIGQAEPSSTPASPGKPTAIRWMLVANSSTSTTTESWAVTTGDATLAYRGYDLPDPHVDAAAQQRGAHGCLQPPGKGRCHLRLGDERVRLAPGNSTSRC